MRRGGRESRQPVDIWPGFVDALSTLLLSIIFLLVVFVLGQFFLSQILQRSEGAVGRLESEVRDLSGQLGLERDAATELRRTLGRLNADLQTAFTERDQLTARLAGAEEDRERLGEQLVTMTDEQRRLQEQLGNIRSRDDQSVARIDELERALDVAQTTVAADKATIELQLGQLVSLRDDVERLTALRDDLERRVTDLSQGRSLADAQRDQAQAQAQALNDQIAQLSGQLQELAAALGTKQSEIEQQSTTIADLGQRLNVALASKVEELSAYRSEFFGRLRELLSTRDDVRIVGDRFVFQSEVLFDSGSADINPSGEAALTRLAATLQEATKDLPLDLPWVLQVDGHTDRRPIASARFPSNWELSTARAISVAQFLIGQGISRERVAATGFAEFQPLDPGESEEAYQRNRRIEIKLTTR